MLGSWDAVFLTNCVGSTMCLALKGVLIETFETSTRSSPMMASAQQGHSGTNVVVLPVQWSKFWEGHVQSENVQHLGR